MKFRTTLCLFLAAACLSVMSCNKDEGPRFSQATVTVKTADNGECYLQLDDKTALKPENMKTNPFKREVRAIMVYVNGDPIEVANSPYKWTSCSVAEIDSIRTKKPVAPGTAKSNSGIEILRSWANTIEDGYLTLAFESEWGYGPATHYLNLETTEIANVFVLKHDNNGDIAPVRYATGLIAFDLHGLLPEGSDITIKYEGYKGSKAIIFRNKDGQYSTPESSSLPDTNKDAARAAIE